MATSIMTGKSVKLGFVEEETDLRLLSSHFFPSKMGGQPAWLSLEPILGPEDLSCSVCGGPSTFLLQVYAPLTLTSMRCDTFHRTIFVFVCPNASCCKVNSGDNFKVFRSQLPLKNTFYSSEPPKEDLEEADEIDVSVSPNASHFQSLCRVCGIKGPKKCGRCKKVFYCSKYHQVLDWKVEHKKICSEFEGASTKARETNEYHERYPGIVFREFELVTEDEGEELEEGKDKKELSEEERLQEFEMLMRSPHLQSLDKKFKTEELETAATCETEDDKQFRKFKERIGSEPAQVLRYCRGGSPLWVSSSHQSRKEDIPVCACGAEREFEFQIMPQLLNYLGVDTLEDSLDWGTLCVYTCSESCSIQTTYVPEFLWKQDFENASNSLMRPDFVEVDRKK